MIKITKTIRNIYIDADVWNAAKAKGINISKFVSSALKAGLDIKEDKIEDEKLQEAINQKKAEFLKAHEELRLLEDRKKRMEELEQKSVVKEIEINEADT